MSIWICRAGKKAIYVEKFLLNNKIYCTWDGFAYDLNSYENKEILKERIKEDNTAATPTAINTWTAQLLILRDKMQIGDIVLTPNENSKSYNIGIVESDYIFNSKSKEHFYHSRNVKWNKSTVTRDLFPQHVIYSMGAYRTIFKLKYENEFYEIINKIGIKI